MVPVARVREFAGDVAGSFRGGRQIYASGGRGGFDIADFFQASRMIILGIVALLVVILVFFTAYSCSPTTFHVNGQEVSAIRATTYQGLIDQGLLETKKGNLTAVDGEVLEEGAGKDPTVYVDGEQVELGARASETGEITAQDGEDEIEPYTATQQITPITTKVARGTSSGEYTGDFNFYMGVLHVVTDPGQEGITETRTGETTGKTATVEVQEMKPRLFENLDAVLPADKKLVALTFDDGPNPVEGGTNEILPVLAKYNAKGTFFMLGTQAEEYPELAKKVADAGHQVASHSYSHDEEHYLNQTTMDDVRTQISKGREVVKQASGQDPAYMRPPGGNISEEAIIAAEDLTDGYIGWSIDTLDYTLPGPDVIASTVFDEIAPGAVILMHDGGGDRTQTAEALEEIIPKLQAQGYTFVTVNELVQAILAERGDTAQGASADGQDAAQTQDTVQTQDGSQTQDGVQDGALDQDAQGEAAEEDEEQSA